MATYRVRIRASRPAPSESARPAEGNELAIAAFRRVDADTPQEAATTVGRKFLDEEPRWTIEKLQVSSEEGDLQVFTFDGEQAQPLEES
jgi:hypothetical protein